MTSNDRALSALTFSRDADGCRTDVGLHATSLRRLTCVTQRAESTHATFNGNVLLLTLLAVVAYGSS